MFLKYDAALVWLQLCLQMGQSLDVCSQIWKWETAGCGVMAWSRDRLLFSFDQRVSQRTETKYQLGGWPLSASPSVLWIWDLWGSLPLAEKPLYWQGRGMGLRRWATLPTFRPESQFLSQVSYPPLYPTAPLPQPLER